MAPLPYGDLYAITLTETPRRHDAWKGGDAVPGELSGPGSPFVNAQGTSPLSPLKKLLSTITLSILSIWTYRFRPHFMTFSAFISSATFPLSLKQATRSSSDISSRA